MPEQNSDFDKLMLQAGLTVPASSHVPDLTPQVDVANTAGQASFSALENAMKDIAGTTSKFDLGTTDPISPNLIDITGRYPTQLMGYNNEALYNQNQSAAENIYNGILGGIQKIGMKTVGGIGYLSGLLGIGNNHQNYGQGIASWIAGAGDNALSVWAKQQEEELRSIRPVYQAPENAGEGVFYRASHDLSFWTSDVTDALAFLYSAGGIAKVIGGAGLGIRAVSALAKGVEAEAALAETAFSGALEGVSAGAKGYEELNKLAQVSKFINNAKLARKIDQITAATLNANMEAMSEATDSKNKILTSLDSDQRYMNLSQEEKNRIAAESARDVFGTNLAILSLSSMMEADWFLKKLPSTSSQLAERASLKKLFATGASGVEFKTALKDYAKDFAVGALKGIATEGFYEENLQLATQRFNEEQAENREEKGSFFRNLFNQTAGTLKRGVTQIGGALAGEDIEASTSIFLGGLLGAGGTAVQTRSEYLQNKKNQKWVEQNITNASTQFKELNDIYEKEEFTKEDGSTAQRIKFDDNGKPIINTQKVNEFIATQSKMLELADLLQLEDSKRNHFAKELYENELFSRYALSFFENGLGNQLLEKLDDVAGLSEDEIMAMGYDPVSKNGLEAKMMAYKAHALELQKLYDNVQNNILPSASVAQYDPNSFMFKNIKEYDAAKKRAFDNRKNEIFRLGARQLTLDNMMRTIDTTIANSAAYVQSTTAPTMQDNFITQLNEKVAISASADFHLDAMEVDAQAKRDANQKVDEAALQSAQAAATKAQKELDDFKKLNAEELNNVKVGEDGMYKYSPEKEQLAQTRDLKIAQLKKAEMILSRNSVIERMSRLADPKNGQKFYDDYTSQIEESQKPKPVTRKMTLAGKELADYETYERKRMRGKRITSAYEGIKQEYLSAVATIGIDQADINRLNDITNGILNMKGTLSKEDRQKLLDAIVEKITPLQDEINTRLQDIENEIDNTPVQRKIPGTEIEIYDEEAAERLDQLDEEKASLEDRLATLDDLLAKAESIGEFAPKDLVPDAIRRELAEEYFIDGEQISQGIALSDQGYDTQEELDKVQREIRELSTLKDIFTQRDTLLSTKEFTGFMSKLDKTLERLRDAEKEISRRLTDRNAKNQKVAVNNSILYGHQVGIDFVGQGTNDTFTTIVDVINRSFPQQASDILSNIDKWMQEQDSDKRLGIVGGITDLYKLAYDRLDKDGKEAVDKQFEELKKKALAVVASNPIMKEMTDSTPNALDEYANNPGLIFIGGFLSIVLRFNKSKFDIKKGRAFYKFREDRDVISYLENVSKEERIDDANYTKEDLEQLVKAHIQYMSINDMSKDNSIDTLSYTEVAKELEIQKQNPKGLTPSNQQLKSLRELVSFFHVDVKNELYRAFAYLKGPAGSGKSSIVGKWVPELLNLKPNEIFAIGHNTSSSMNINNILGKATTQYADLVEALGERRDLRLVLIDEIGGFSRDQLDVIAKKVQTYNEGKALNEQVKVILLGDPNQLNINNEGELQDIPDVERVYLDGDEAIANNMTYISPLTIRFRSNVGEISNFSDKFINQNKDLSQEEIIVKSNNPTLNPETTRQGKMTGIVGTKDFRGDVVKILSNTNTDDGLTRAIIVNPGKEKEYRDLLQQENIKNVEVLSYVDAQGRTIDEVFIKIDNTSELSSQKIYNKALYVATSRATNFILVDNMDIRNEEDSDILAQKTDTAKQIEDAKQEFTNSRNVEKDTIKDIVGEEETKREDSKFEKEFKKEEPKKEKEPVDEDDQEEDGATESGTGGIESNLATILDEAEQEEELPEEYDEEELEEAVKEGIVDKEELENEEDISVLEKVKRFSEDIPDKLTKFIHNLKFPSFNATKNFVKFEGKQMFISDSQLKKLRKAKRDVEVLQRAVKEKDTIYYLPVRDEDKIFFVMVSEEKNEKGKVKEGYYRQVGVLSQDEINKMKGTSQNELYNTLTKAQTSKDTRTVSISLSQKNNIPISDIEKKFTTTGKVGNIAHMKFTYKGDTYQKFDLSATITQFAEGFFGEKVTPEKIAKVKELSSIHIFNQAEVKTSAFSNLLPGIPYLVLRGLEQVEVTSKGKVASGAKEMYIRLDRRQVHKSTHGKYLQPYFDFVEKVTAWDKLITSSKSKEKEKYLFGKEDGNMLIRNLNKAEDVQKELESLGFKDLDSKKVAALAAEIKDLWRKTPTEQDIRKGKDVYVKVTDAEGNETSVKTKIIKVKKEEGRPLEVDVVLNGKVVPKLASEVELAGEVPGAAQQVLNQLWNANKAGITKMKLFRGRKIKRTILAPSLLSPDNNIGWNSEELANFMSFDKEGNHIYQDGDNKLQFRIPVPRMSKNKDINAYVNFKTKERNSADIKLITDYFLQNNFEMVEQTVISVVHGKGEEAIAPKPAPTPKTPTGLSIEEKTVPVIFGQGTETEYRVKVGNKIVAGFKTRQQAEDRLNEINKTLTNATITKPVNLGDGVSVKGLKVGDTTYSFLKIQERPVTLIDINGVTIPFYMTTGLGGKNLTPGWYPMFGFSTHGWLNKTRGEDMATYYDRLVSNESAALLKKAAEKLNAKYGTDPNNILETGIVSAEQVHKIVNDSLAFKPVEHTDDANRMGLNPQEQYTKLKENIRSLGEKLENAKSPTGGLKTNEAEKINKAENAAIRAVTENVNKKYPKESEEKSRILADKIAKIRETYEEKRAKLAPQPIAPMEDEEVDIEEAKIAPPFATDITTTTDETLQNTHEEDEEDEEVEALMNSRRGTPKKEEPKPSGRRASRGRSADKARYTVEELGEFLTQDKVMEMVQYYFPKFTNENLKDKVKFVGEAEMMRLTMGQPSWGLFYKNTIYLLKNPDDTVNANIVKHELFHMIYNNYLTQAERDRVKNIVLRDEPKTIFLDDEELDEYIDEYMADLFMKTTVPSGVSAFIRNIINRIRNFFNFVSPNINTLNDLFTAINRGYITTRFKTEAERIDSYIDKSILNSTIDLNC